MFVINVAWSSDSSQKHNMADDILVMLHSQRVHILAMLHPSTFPYTGDVAPLNVSIYW